MFPHPSMKHGAGSSRQPNFAGPNPQVSRTLAFFGKLLSNMLMLLGQSSRSSSRCTRWSNAWNGARNESHGRTRRPRIKKHLALDVTILHRGRDHIPVVHFEQGKKHFLMPTIRQLL